MGHTGKDAAILTSKPSAAKGCGTKRTFSEVFAKLSPYPQPRMSASGCRGDTFAKAGGVPLMTLSGQSA